MSRSIRAVLLSVPLAALALPASAQEEAAAQTGALEEIMVTAQRREQGIQTVPVAVTAIDPATIERRQVTDSKQLVFNVPNLTGNSNVGQSSANSFFMRGVGTTENLATADTSVGLYLDDVYIARQGANNFNLVDIERIEVLRGPQGTLYGRNTNGGAIKIVTKKPSADSELAVRGSYGNHDRWDLKLSGNSALTDKLYARANFLTQQGDGYIRNSTLGKDVNDLDYVGGRIALRQIASDKVELNLALDYSEDKTNGNYSSDIAGVLRPSTGNIRTVVSGLDAFGDAITWGGALHVDWKIDDRFSLKSITGYRNTDQDLNIDLSDQPVPLYNLLQHQKSDQVSQEFQLNGDLTQRLNFVAGVYYFDESSDVTISDRVRATPAAAQNQWNKVYTVDVDSYAAFGQLEYSLGPVTLVGAARYTWEDRSFDVVQTSTLPGPLFNYTTADLIARGAAGQAIDVDREFSKFTPKLGVNWQVSDELFAYASYTKGFRSGGWTGRALRSDQFVNVDPENVESWEIGAKATLLNGRIRWNTSLFTMDYTDLFNTLTVAGVYTVATADARIDGAETEFTLRATPWLDLFANLGYLDTKYEGQKPVNLADELQRAPQLQVKAGFSIDYPLASGSLLVNADAFYTDKYLVTPANLAVTAPLLPSGVDTTGDFTIVNASVGYRWNEGKYELIAACTNCFDEDYFEGGTYIGSYAAVWTGAPRFYKVSFGVKL
ncbi:MAG: TonB-dependent receptor [Steroidobacteraceae bacterium]